MKRATRAHRRFVLAVGYGVDDDDVDIDYVDDDYAGSACGAAVNCCYAVG